MVGKTQYGQARGNVQPPTPKSLFRRVEKTLDTIEHGQDILATIRNVAEYMTANFRHDLGILGGRIYKLADQAYELVQVFGTAAPVTPGVQVPVSYAAIEALLDSGLVVMSRNAPELDPAIEARLGTGERFAAIAVADGEYLLSFDVADVRGSVEDLQASLNIIRLAINQKLRQERFQEILEDARRIQRSILPKRPPHYTGYDIAGDSRPAEIVGGDFFDYIPMSAEMVDIAIADASGHGLPAALQVRDVYTGLRMGLSRDLKVARTVERLNAIINRSRMTSKFVSLFLAELETNGNMVYVNAGHNPPFIVHARGGTEFLREGGMVLGPSPDASYPRGFAELAPGDMLVLYTDGITECHHLHSGEEFGLARLERLVRRHAARQAAEIVQTVFQAVSRYAGAGVPEDDQTVVVVRRLLPNA